MIPDFILNLRIRVLLWLVAFAGLVFVVLDRFDLFTIRRDVPMPDGSIVRLANGWYTVDHPFHVTRAQTLLTSLRDGELTRWFGQHHGGYPADFYPTGAAWLDVALWMLTFGGLPIEVVHKALIAVIVLAPAFIMLWWVKRDRLSPGVALLAGTGHAVIAGEWWSGGWTEVALWGLVTNVAAQTAILGTLVGVLGWLKYGTTGDLGIAVLFAGLALGTNPRTALGLVAVGLAAVIVAVMQPTSTDVRTVVRRGLVLGALSAGIAAPVLLPLIRYRDLYYFVHYSGYADLRAWWTSSQTALWEPIFWLALCGIFLGLARPGRQVTRTAAIAAVLYMGATAGMVVSGAAMFDQLELTRLMPFQRMILFYLAAISVHDGLDFAIQATRRLVERTTKDADSANRLPVSLAMAGMAILLVVTVVLEPASWVPDEQRGMRPLPSSAHAATYDFEQAVKFADAAAPDGTAILVLGTVLSWHQGLAAPMWSDRRFFYDDWLWYWQRDHVGPYNPDTEHAYPTDTATLTPGYLALHGIGAVVVADVSGQANREIAGASPLLTRVRQGLWFDVLIVNAPTSIVTAGSVVASEISIDDRSIRAAGAGASGTVTVRHNWHPRWQANVNGADAPVSRRADGYMDVTVPAGDYDLTLTYAVTRLDWIARLLFITGVAIALALVARRPLRAMLR